MGSSNTNSNTGTGSSQGGGLMDLNSIISRNNSQPQQASGDTNLDFMNMGWNHNNKVIHHKILRK